MEMKKNNSEYIFEFDKFFCYLCYWGVWLGVVVIVGIVLMLLKFCDFILVWLGCFVG